MNEQTVSNEKVKIKYYDRINKELIEIEVDKSVRRAINKYNKREKRQREKLKDNEVMSLDYLKEIGVEIESDDFNEEQKELLSLEEKRKRKTKLALYRAMRKLTPRQRQIVTMHYFEKKSYEKIANEIGISKSSVRDTLYESHSKMKKIIEKSKNINFF